MSTKVSDHVLERLREWGVEHVLHQLTWEMRAMEGGPSFLPSQQLPDVQYAAFARSLGLTGIRVEKPEDVEAGREKK